MPESVTAYQGVCSWNPGGFGIGYTKTQTSLSKIYSFKAMTQHSALLVLRHCPRRGVAWLTAWIECGEVLAHKITCLWVSTAIEGIFPGHI
jgi:hypothetical protein